MNDRAGNGSQLTVVTGQSLEANVRLRETGRLAGDSVRAAVAGVSAQIMTLVVDAEQQVAKMREDAEEFAESLKSIGEAHASRLESALDELRTTVETVRRERERVIALTKPE